MTIVLTVVGFLWLMLSSSFFVAENDNSDIALSSVFSAINGTQNVELNTLGPCDFYDHFWPVCFNDPSLSAVLLLLLSVILLPLVFKTLYFILDVPTLPQPRRNNIAS
ncbi:hypothetical protein [Shewanella youngdeokensis]|uniref:Uncharacterized protein n=1 Tax=Shewanella youngdeokensis TaxID=2999068 RepID=A0ABZ0JVR8_9GAMM|nr:hypothetical protein RGE70_13885 [Shewanella sp. DAU334]